MLCRFCGLEVKYDYDTNRWIDVQREVPHNCRPKFQRANELPKTSLREDREQKYPHLYWNDARGMWFCKQCERHGDWFSMESHWHKTEEEKSKVLEPGQTRLF